MKKLLALLSSLLLVATFGTPAQSAGAKYSVYQKTLAAFSSSATGLTSQQKAQVKATVQANPDAEKFICTGIRYYDQPMSVNITVRKRAKAACEYAKQLNPALSTWYQNKPTKARSYAGKVLLTVKIPDAVVGPDHRASSYEPSTAITMFEQGCQKFSNGTLRHKYLDKYRSIVTDICSGFEMDYSLVEVKTSPRVDAKSVELYVENNVFGLSYWNKYVSGGLRPMKVLLLMEDEQDWWRSNLEGLVTLTPEWFGPTDGGGHCYAAEAEAFCPKAYYDLDGETSGNFNVLTAMLGSKVDWNTFRKIVPIHEATHQFHSTTGLGHWRWWFIEGQATYFELAASVLVPGLGASGWRDEIVRDTYSRDELKFNASNVEETVAYIDQCNRTGKCNGFRYFGASLAHELLVESFGIDSYLKWNEAIAERLPNFYWRGMDEVSRALGNQGFEDAFNEFFGVNIRTWETNDLAQFVFETYNCEVKGARCN